ncbi:MAG: amidase [Streptosporangiales bacterium]|nr:amidase [Streptosporangiales bacterium]
MPDTDLCYLSATEASRLFREHELSPVELMRALIAHTEQVEPVVNAFTERLFDQALREAARAEQRFLGNGPAPRPLEGIPVATKEKHAIAGRSLTEGSLANLGNVAAENVPVVDRILDAGGIIHARTTTPEFSIACFTHTKLWGVTRNPWNPDYTPGGSSGGSAASLAAGTSLLATGSDIGGSTRIPAAFTGTVGYKAPYGRIPGATPLSLDHYRGDGPLARTVDDCLAFTNVLAGPDPRDHTSLRPKQVLPEEYESVAGMRLALCVRLGDYEVHPEIAANTRAVADALTDAGAHVDEVELPWRRDDFAAAVSAHFATIFGAIVTEVVAEHRDKMNAYTVAFADEMAAARRQHSYLDGLRVEHQLQGQLAEGMDPFDALLCPTTAVPGIPAGDDVTDPDAMVMTAPFNVTNRCPVLNVPSGHASCGLPTGVQIVGHTYDDATVFRVGKAVEELRPWAYLGQPT